MTSKHRRNGKPEKVSADLLKVLQDAVGDLNKAQTQRDAIVAAIIRHYNLSSKDEVELSTGIIKRQV